MSSIPSTFTSFTCWSAKPVTNALNLLCLHITYIVTTVAIIDIMATMNLNILTTGLLKKFLFANSFSHSSRLRLRLIYLI